MANAKHGYRLAVFSVPVVVAAFFFGSILGDSYAEQLVWIAFFGLGGLTLINVALRMIDRERR